MLAFAEVPNVSTESYTWKGCEVTIQTPKPEELAPAEVVASMTGQTACPSEERNMPSMARGGVSETIPTICCGKETLPAFVLR